MTKTPNSSLMSGKSINSSPLIDKFNDPIDDKDTIYILFVGMTGVVTYEDENNKFHEFTLGDVIDYKIGSSETQYSRQYRIKLPDGKTLCLIDAPGVGDPQGTLQDNKHFENILHEISSLKKLNAICILMNPYETRATVLFKYCLNQYLLHLHSSAKDNIFFCFANSRSKMYKPGPTMAILEDHLKKMKVLLDIDINTIGKTFCFDNESFDYLAVKLYSATTGIKTSFPEEFAVDLGRSWDKSSKEFGRLLKEISKVQPHDVANTICLNNTRTMISNLAQPISKCVSNINTNIKLIEEYDIIKKAIVDFSVFLWHHSLIKYNLYYEEYIHMQIISQYQNSENPQEIIQKLKEHLSEYKASFKEFKQNAQNKVSVKTQKEIIGTFDKLLTLPNVGYIIQNQIKLKQSSLYKSEAVEIDLFSKMKTNKRINQK
ncbi:hypothetical protein ACTFIY_006699 [Dictyostelium cf. discoideum]